MSSLIVASHPQSASRKIASWFTFPVIFSGQVAALYFGLKLGYEPGLTLLAITVANITLIALLELWLPDRPEWRWINDRQFFNDIFHGLGNELAGGVGLTALLVLFATIGGQLSEQGSLGLWPSSLPFLIQLFLAISIVDFFDYWKHRVYHGSRYAWPIHAVHHNMDRMHVLKGIRLHFLEAAIRSLIVYSPLIILGASSEITIWIAALMTFGGSLNHSNLQQRLPRIIHALIPTKDTHWLHHDKDYRRGSCNFSPLTMMFDHLFGTFRHPFDYPLREVGIDPDPIPSDLIAQMGAPFVWPMLMKRHQRKMAAIPNGEEV